VIVSTPDSKRPFIPFFAVTIISYPDIWDFLRIMALFSVLLPGGHDTNI